LPESQPKPTTEDPASASQGAVAAAAAAAEASGSPADALGDEALHQLFYGGRAAPREGEGGLTAAQEESLYHSGRIPPTEEAEALVAADTPSPALPRGFRRRTEHKFPLPEKPFPADFNHKKRYHPVVDLFVRLIMKDGKLAAAQRHMATLMNVLRTSPAPIYSPKFPLLPGTPPASHLPLNPILYLTIAVDSVAPLLKIKHLAGGAGGGRALEIPVPLHLRTRRRHAFQWILEAVSKKPSKGSGKKQFGHRLAEEIIAVVEGRSSVWEKRKMVHKLGTAARVNVGTKKRVKKKKSG